MCRAYYDDIPRTQICTSGRGRVGTCDGDSGGPLVIKTLGNDILVILIIELTFFTAEYSRYADGTPNEER